MIAEFPNHGKILDKILKEKKIKKTEFAIGLGYTKNNYTNSLNRPNYSEKMIEKVSAALGVEPSVFIHAPITQVGDGNTANVSVGELKAYYEKQLADKDKVIASQELTIQILMDKK